MFGGQGSPILHAAAKDQPTEPEPTRNPMPDTPYTPQEIEPRWQAYWQEHKTNEVDLDKAQNPYYTLMMFPYPSAEGLHVGNVYAFTGADIHGRFKRLQGNDVFEPIGFDAFGIHSENYAMKVGIHPMELVPRNVNNFRRQLRMMGLMLDWSHEVDTTSPEYYKWTQWVFLQLYKAGFAYRDTKEVNFCPSCGTVIADEQVNPDGTCERHHDTKVERRKLPCWFFKITAFADRLLDNHDWLDWSEITKTAQIEWIGRSKGAEVDFPVAGRQETIRVFTTRPDTLFGATYMVLAPEHPLVDVIADPAKEQEIVAYRAACAARTEEERIAVAEKEKTGVDIGAKAVNPLTGWKIPIFISDYVMMGYGTGAIMAVPSGDHRDFAFAQKFNLPIPCIIDPDVDRGKPEDLSGVDDGANLLQTAEGRAEIRRLVLDGKACWSGDGKAIHSANDELDINGLPVEEAKRKTTEYLEQKGLGEFKTTYRLRDWGISRQRYWGPPVPILYDEEGNEHPVREEDLPVPLPPVEDFRPKGDGRGPLAAVPEWVNTTLPDGRPARRETDVMDNFLDSAWYFLRYVSASDPDCSYDPALIDKWLPIDMYIGGNEHAKLHLMYTRFICMGLTEAGALKMGKRPEMKDRGEPFRKFRAHGLLIKEGAKMSKSKGNVVNPDDYVTQFGADTLRMYLMFLGPYSQGGDFRDKDIAGVRRFLERVWRWYTEEQSGSGVSPEIAASHASSPADAEMPKPALVKLHQTIKKVGQDLENLSYNTAIAALMELHNTLKNAEAVSPFARDAFALMLAPLAPHFAEEIWQRLGHPPSIFDARWPEFDPTLTVEDEVELAVQVNGKVRDRFSISRDADEAAIREAALALPRIKEQLAGQEPRRVIIVPNRLVNVIIK